MRPICIALTLSLITAACTSASPPTAIAPATAQSLTVFAAASLTEACNEIAAQFQ
jgi:ABC-type molybdate transport system substrate-binding protein